MKISNIEAEIKLDMLLNIIEMLLDSEEFDEKTHNVLVKASNKIHTAKDKLKWLKRLIATVAINYAYDQAR